MSSNNNSNRKDGEKKSSEEKDASNSSTLSNPDFKPDVPSKTKVPKIIMVKPVEQTKDFVYSKDSPQMPTTTGRDPCKVKNVCDLTETLSFAEDSITTRNATTRRPLSGTESSSDNEDTVCVGAEASTDETDITKSRSETDTLENEIVNIEEGVNETAGLQDTTEENDYNVKVSQSTELAYSETQRPRNKRLRRRSSVDVVTAQRNISFEVFTTQNVSHFQYPQEGSRTRRQPLPAVVEGEHPRNGLGHRLRKAARRAAHFLRKRVFCCLSQSEALSELDL